MYSGDGSRASSSSGAPDPSTRPGCEPRSCACPSCGGGAGSWGGGPTDGAPGGAEPGPSSTGREVVPAAGPARSSPALADGSAAGVGRDEVPLVEAADPTSSGVAPQAPARTGAASNPSASMRMVPTMVSFDRQQSRGRRGDDGQEIRSRA